MPAQPSGEKCIGTACGQQKHQRRKARESQNCTDWVPDRHGPNFRPPCPLVILKCSSARFSSFLNPAGVSNGGAASNASPSYVSAKGVHFRRRSEERSSRCQAVTCGQSRAARTRVLPKVLGRCVFPRGAGGSQKWKRSFKGANRVSLYSFSQTQSTQSCEIP